MEKHSIEIIAEIGINHGGNMRLFVEMICRAKECGADCVKTQLYDPMITLRKDDFSKEELGAVLDSTLSKSQVIFIDKVCRDEGIDLLFSVFDYERLGWLEEIGVKRYKIASRTVLDEALCLAIFNTGKPILVSDGYILDYNQFNSINARIFKYGERVKWLSCVSQYPTPLENVALSKLQTTMLNHYYTGFSDHTVGTSAAKIAIVYGAEVIEKHFTSDKSSPGPDHICSADEYELRDLCNFRDDFEKMKGE